MTNSDENQPAAERAQPEQATARILELLDKLAAAEGLGNAASATGFTEDQLRSSLREAAQIIRKNQGDLVKKRWPLLGSLLDWREMTVAEALEILADHALGAHGGFRGSRTIPRKRKATEAESHFQVQLLHNDRIRAMSSGRWRSAPAKQQ